MTRFVLLATPTLILYVFDVVMIMSLFQAFRLASCCKPAFIKMSAFASGVELCCRDCHLGFEIGDSWCRQCLDCQTQVHQELCPDDDRNLGFEIGDSWWPCQTFGKRLDCQTQEVCPDDAACKFAAVTELCPDMCSDDCPYCYSGTDSPGSVRSVSESPPMSPDRHADGDSDSPDIIVHMDVDSPTVVQVVESVVPEMFQLNSARTFATRAFSSRPVRRRFLRALIRGEHEFAKRLATLNTRRLDGRRCACGGHVSAICCNESWHKARTIKTCLKVHHKFCMYDVVARTLLNKHRRARVISV